MLSAESSIAGSLSRQTSKSLIPVQQSWSKILEIFTVEKLLINGSTSIKRLRRDSQNNSDTKMLCNSKT
jgi:hypothetical protein